VSAVPDRAPRVLLVGFSGRNKYFGSLFYATIHKIRNGFIRAGSHVIWFSDRDTADFATPFRIRHLGSLYANAKLIELVQRVEPDILCLMHTDLISARTLARIRKSFPRVRVVTVCIDWILTTRTERFAGWVKSSHLSFATTAGDGLKAFSTHGTVGFIPNPVDCSVENCQSFLGTEHDYDFFFAGKPRRRESLLTDIQSLGPEYKLGFFVQRGKRLALSGAAYIEGLSRSRIAVNASLSPCPLWYSSDRIAQYFAAGCLVAQPAEAQLEDLYGRDAILTFTDAKDLLRQAEPLLADESWREMARHGRERAVAISDATLVARYIIDRCRETQTFEWPAWSAQFYPGPPPDPAGS
jgi:Glycosyl transferases group 1